MNLTIKSLSDAETIIERGLKNFVEVGAALLHIRDQRLYKETHKTFEDYCRERWGIAKSQAYRMISASEAASNLSPVGDKPSSERVIRPLTKLPPEKQAEAWERAVENSDGKPTAKDVQQAVEEIQPKDTATEFANALGFDSAEEATEAMEGKEKTRRISHPRPSDGMQYATMAIADLKKIDPRDQQREEAFEYVIAWINKQNKRN